MPLLGCRNSLRVGSNNPFSLYETLRVVLEIKSLEDRNQELEKRVKQEDADKEQLRQERAKTELQSRQIVEKLRAEVAQESECHKDTKRKRPYESQLAMLLAISLLYGMAWKLPHNPVRPEQLPRKP
jgi:hypothetical protein